MSRFRLVGFVIACSIVVAMAHGPARATAGEERWKALSMTALSTTGDILLSPSQLKAAGHAWPLKVAADLPVYDGLLGKAPARVLEVTAPSDPKLLNGNTFGCDQPIRWIVVYRQDNGRMLAMEVFSGGHMPRSSSDAGGCALYTYTRP